MTGPVATEALVEALQDLVSAFEVSELDGTVDIAPGRHLGATLMNVQGVLSNTHIGPLADEIDRLRSRVKFLETEWSEATDRHEAAVREQHHLEEKLDKERRARRTAEASLATATSELARLRAEGEAKDRRIAELSETWTDEAGTVWSPPTAWAYAQACAALRKHRAEGEKLRRELSSYRVAVAEVLHDHMSAQCSLTGASQTEVAQHAARSIRRCISDRTALARAATAREGA